MMINSATVKFKTSVHQNTIKKKNTIKKVKRPGTNWENIFATYKLTKFLYRIHEELIMNQKKRQK